MSRWNSPDLSGQRIGLWSVGEVVSSGPALKRYQCTCDCGVVKLVRACHLVGGKSKSCGCTKAARLGDSARKHGLSATSLYQLWMGIRARCFNPSHSSYHRYGGRGITMCDVWKDDFVVFAHDMGERPSKSHSVDRIDVDGHYFPENCRWATPSQQANNSCRNHRIQVGADIFTLAEAARKFGLPYHTLKERIYRGVAPDLAVLP